MKTSLIASSTTRLVRAFAVLAALATASLSATTYQLYSYTGTVANATNITDGSGGFVNFGAGTAITGQIYVENGIANTSTWGFAGEVGQYNNSVASFSFNSSPLSITGTGLGGSYVSNNRRLSASAGSARQDNFLASLNSGFTPTTLGGGVGSLNLSLNTNFGQNLTAITSTNLPTVLDVNLFNNSRTVTLNFNNSSSLIATLSGISVTTVSSIASVPDNSATLASLGLAIGLLGLIRRKMAR